MYHLVISTVLYSMTFTHTAGDFADAHICQLAAHGLSGPNFVVSCEEPSTHIAAGFGMSATSFPIINTGDYGGIVCTQNCPQFCPAMTAR